MKVQVHFIGDEGRAAPWVLYEGGSEVACIRDYLECLWTNACGPGVFADMGALPF